MRRTKIVCTIGPASEKRLPEMIEAGMNVARLNFSHGDYEEHGARIRDIREASKAAGKVVTVLLDTKGPEIRTHTFEEGKALLEKGKEVIIVSTEEIVGTKDRFSVTYALRNSRTVTFAASSKTKASSRRRKVSTCLTSK